MPDRRDLSGYMSIVVTVLLVLICAGCGGGSGVSGLQPDSQAGFQLAVLPDTFLGEDPSGRITMTVNESPAVTQVVIRGTELSGLRACYFQLDYDPERFDPRGVAWDSVWSREPGMAANETIVPLSLEVLDTPGRVDYGVIMKNPDQRRGIDGDAVLARVTFDHLPWTPRVMSAPPVTDGSRTEANWDSSSQTLTWLYDCQGDYNQDGLVTVTDLTPVGQQYDRVGPFDPTDSLSVVDGNEDGAITVSDITPIGQNFGRGVEGYDVYASPDPADLPEENDELPSTPPITHIPFADAQGNPLAQRLMFAAEFPGISDTDILWVRPVSEAQAGTPSTGDLPTECTWVIRDVSSYASIQSEITYSSLAIIAGHPAIAYQSLDGDGIYYQRALDPTGYAWGDEVLVDAGSNGHRTISMIEWEGRPAICHHGDDGVVEFIRAADSTGNTWLEPAVIATTAAGGWDCHLAIVNDQPAVCFQDTDNASLMYARAQSAADDDWESPTAIADLGSTTPEGGGFSSLAVIDNNPAVAFFHPGDQSLNYVHAHDPDGGSWAAPVLADNGTDVGRWCSLAEVAGHPAISYEEDDGLCYIRANDPGGSEWGPVTFVDERSGRGEDRDTSLHVVHGRPAISYYSGYENADLMYTTALDPEGRTWSTPQVVDSYLMVGRSTTLKLIDERPCISYLDETNMQVRFAICLLGDNLPPVARCTANPSRVEASEEFYLDGSGSYDPDGQITTYEWDLDGDDDFETNTGDTSVVVHSFVDVGVHRIQLRVIDNNGDEGISEQLVFVGDIGSPPEAELSAANLDIEAGQAVSFDASDSTFAGGEIILYEWDFAGDGDFEVDTGDSPTVDQDYMTEGIYNAAVRVHGSNGLSNIAQVCINVGNLNQRPVAVLSAYPWWGNPPWTMKLDASGSHDPDGTIVKYEFDCDRDGYYEYDAGTAPSYHWLCEEYGGRRVKLRVTDNDGAQDTTWMLCSSNEQPVAAFTHTPKTGNAPLKMTFDGSPSHDPDGSISTYGWDIHNDGSYEKVGTGAPGIWKTELVWNGPIKVRLKVRDDMGGTAETIKTIHVNKGWHIKILDPIGIAGILNDLEHVNGAPAIAYYEQHSRDLRYIRGTDTYGYSAWSNPIAIGKIAAKGYHAYDLDLEVVGDYRPAIGFSGHLSNDPCYVLAKNTTGTQWNPFVSAWPGGPCGTAELEFINSKPMLGAVILGVRTARAKDSLGTTWNPHTVAAATPKFTAGSTINMGVVNGHPAIVYGDVISYSPYKGGLKYTRATDPNGAAWSTPVWVDTTDNPGEDAKLAVINGYPAVAYVGERAAGGYEVRYKRADNQNGTTWTQTAVQVMADGRGVLGLVTVAGAPAIGLVTCKGHDLMYLKATDANGASFPIIHVVDATDMNNGLGSFGGSMITINGKPAMSYHHGQHASLKYAAWE